MKEEEIFQFSFFSALAEAEFFDRQREVDHILKRATLSAGEAVPSMVLVGKRAIGKTEILRQVYNRLFWSQEEVVPFYFIIGDDCRTVEDFARRYLMEFIKQYLAFKRRKIRLSHLSNISIVRLKDLCEELRESWLINLLKLFEENLASEDHVNLINNSITAPRYTALHTGCGVLTMIDEFPKIKNIRLNDQTVRISDLFQPLLKSSHAPHLLTTSSRRSIEELFKNSNIVSDIEVLELSSLPTEDGMVMFEVLCKKNAIGYNRDFVLDFVEQLQGNPFYIRNVIHCAQYIGGAFTSLRDCQAIYANEITQGNIKLYWSAILRSGSRDPLKRRLMLEIFSMVTSHPSPICTVKGIMNRFDIDEEETKEILSQMETLGLIQFEYGRIKPVCDQVLCDCLGVIYQTEIEGLDSEEARSLLIRERLKSSALSHRQRSRTEMDKQLEKLLNSFDCQVVPYCLFDFRRFSEHYFVVDAMPTADELLKKEQRYKVPQIIGTVKEIIHLDVTPAMELDYSPYIFISYGFKDRLYSSGNEVVWLVELLENTSPVTSFEIEDFEKKCGKLKKKLGPVGVVKWIIGKDNFSPEGLELIDKYEMFSSNLAQLKLLTTIIRQEKESYYATPETVSKITVPATVLEKITHPGEFNLLVPAVRNSELIVARAVEQVAQNEGFDEEAIGQVKMATIEACINAIEHSPSREKKVEANLSIKEDRLEILIQNEGAHIELGKVEEADITKKLRTKHKRGWGLKLIRNLMDHVEFDLLKNGTRIKMIKYKDKEAGKTHHGEGESVNDQK